MNRQVEAEIVYPETDGAPLGEGTLQVGWIIKLFNGFDWFYRRHQNVFVAADLFWYPVRGEPQIVRAPDIMIAFDRPKGHRSTYLQWKEAGVAPQFVMEILSPSITPRDRELLLRFYDRYSVEEYYEYDPEADELKVWVRTNRGLVPIEVPPSGFVSPRVGVRFEAPGGVPMRVIDPEGNPFLSYSEVVEQTKRVREDREKLRKEADGHQAEAEPFRKVGAEYRAIAERPRSATEKLRTRAESLAAKLRELGVDPDSI